MIILVKLLLAHLIGDFQVQPKSWVKEKESQKVKSPKFYLHLLIHGALILVLLWDWTFWPMALAIAIIHGLIDLIKLYYQSENSRLFWFFLDQTLHLISILIVWVWWFHPKIELSFHTIHPSLWVYLTGFFFITQVSAILLQLLLSKWTRELKLPKKYSLKKAGKYIGILERIFVFTFVIMGKWEAIGFLLTAKSVFRFSDLSKSKDRKLTEYILVGTLLSFALATFAGLLVNYLVKINF